MHSQPDCRSKVFQDRAPEYILIIAVPILSNALVPQFHVNRLVLGGIQGARQSSYTRLQALRRRHRIVPWPQLPCREAGEDHRTLRVVLHLHGMVIKDYNLDAGFSNMSIFWLLSAN